MGMISGIGGTVGSAVGGMMSNTIGNAFNGNQAPGNIAGAVIVPGSNASAVCAKCGKSLMEGAKFCLECGAKVEAPAPAVPGMLNCPACGEAVPGGKFCLKCGAPLTPKCPGCGKEVTPDAKFCLECGTKLN
jgi:predicted amidophosphoribosyltransferase